MISVAYDWCTHNWCSSLFLISATSSVCWPQFYRFQCRVWNLKPIFCSTDKPTAILETVILIGKERKIQLRKDSFCWPITRHHCQRRLLGPAGGLPTFILLFTRWYLNEPKQSLFKLHTASDTGAKSKILFANLNKVIINGQQSPKMAGETAWSMSLCNWIREESMTSTKLEPQMVWSENSVTRDGCESHFLWLPTIITSATINYTLLTIGSQKVGTHKEHHHLETIFTDQEGSGFIEAK